MVRDIPDDDDFAKVDAVLEAIKALKEESNEIQKFARSQTSPDGGGDNNGEPRMTDREREASAEKTRVMLEERSDAMKKAEELLKELEQKNEKKDKGSTTVPGVNKTSINQRAFDQMKVEPENYQPNLPDSAFRPTPDMDQNAFMQMCERDMEERAKRKAVGRKQAIMVKEEGNTAFAEEKWEEAKIRYSEALRLSPDFLPLYTNRAQCHMKLGDFAAALSDCDWALRLDEKHVKAHVISAKACAGQRKWTDAHDWLDKAKQLNPNDVTMLDQIGRQLKAEQRRVEILATIQNSGDDAANKKKDVNGDVGKGLIEELASLVTNEEATQTYKAVEDIYLALTKLLRTGVREITPEILQFYRIIAVERGLFDEFRVGSEKPQKTEPGFDTRPYFEELRNKVQSRGTIERKPDSPRVKSLKPHSVTCRENISLRTSFMILCTNACRDCPSNQVAFWKDAPESRFNRVLRYILTVPKYPLPLDKIGSVLYSTVALLFTAVETPAALDAAMQAKTKLSNGETVLVLHKIVTLLLWRLYTTKLESS